MNIFRKPNNEEKSDMTNLLEKEDTVLTRFRKKNTERQQAATENGEPYCYRCAKLDFEKKYKDTLEAIREGVITERKELEFDLKQYADIKRFTKIKVSKQTEEVRVGIQRQSIVTEYQVFQCVKGCKISVKVQPKKAVETKPAEKPVEKQDASVEVPSNENKPEDANKK